MIPSLSACPKRVLARITAVLTDIDDTLTYGGRLPAVAYSAMERLKQTGIKVIPITGRPAGWCDLVARQWPVDAVVGENGAFSFRYDDHAKKMHRAYAQDTATRAHNQRRLMALAEVIMRKFPGTALASDQAYREIDVAIDFCEDVPALPLPVAQQIAAEFIQAGCIAKVSSIHVNAWIGTHDKLTMSLRLLSELAEKESKNPLEEIAYCGDSANDEPMFARFENGFGVANIRPFLPLMKAHPRYIMDAAGGIGFAEFAEAVLAARR
jgi:HAD superfamily hydrolase (TIGR01484 family)